MRQEAAGAALTGGLLLNNEDESHKWTDDITAFGIRERRKSLWFHQGHEEELEPPTR